jgi:hypothetical protein
MGAVRARLRVGKRGFKEPVTRRHCSAVFVPEFLLCRKRQSASERVFAMTSAAFVCSRDAKTEFVLVVEIRKRPVDEDEVEDVNDPALEVVRRIVAVDFI